MNPREREIHQRIAQLLRDAWQLDVRLPPTIHAIEARGLDATPLRELQQELKMLLRKAPYEQA